MINQSYNFPIRRVRAVLTLILSFLFSLALLPTESSWARDREVTLLFVSHIQSQLMPITTKVNKTTVSFGGLSHAAGVVEAEKEKSPDAIFLQTGEAVEGPLWRNFGGKPEFTALNLAGVQVGMFAKHEFDYGFEHMKKGLSHATFPFVVSNISTSDPELDALVKKNLVLPAGNMKVGFFSLLSPWIFSTTQKVEEVQVQPNLVEVAREMVNDLRQQGADVIVMMSNLADAENMEVAKAVSGIHVIVGRGLYYRVVTEPEFVEGPDGWVTPIVVGDAFGKAVGKCSFKTKDGAMVRDSFSFKLIPVAAHSPIHLGVRDIAMKYEELLNLAMDKAIGYFETAVDARNSILRSREAPLGNFAADSVRWKLKTDIGLFNGGGLRGNTVYPAGEISQKTLARILPHNNNLDIVTLTGKQLRSVMEISASALKAERDNYDPTFRTPDGGFLQVSGLRVVYSLSGKPTLFDEVEKLKEWGNRVRSLSVLKNGEWQEVSDDEIYTVAVNSWTASGGDRYFVLAEAPKVHTAYRVTTAFTDYLMTFPGGHVHMKLDDRIIIED
ncbi:MAG: bifunctional metallophosphatase/5'-nucleotidase [Fretibacterium sp.]|nr:bifunctional metallophosphatase/5'-nucleotidase [Fretibacterium sp.]